MRETKSLAKADVLARSIGGVSMAPVQPPKLDAASTTVVEAVIDKHSSLRGSHPTLGAKAVFFVLWNLKDALSDALV